MIASQERMSQRKKDAALTGGQSFDRSSFNFNNLQPLSPSAGMDLSDAKVRFNAKSKSMHFDLEAPKANKGKGLDVDLDIEGVGTDNPKALNQAIKSIQELFSGTGQSERQAEGEADRRRRRNKRESSDNVLTNRANDLPEQLIAANMDSVNPTTQSRLSDRTPNSPKLKFTAKPNSMHFDLETAGLANGKSGPLDIDFDIQGYGVQDLASSPQTLRRLQGFLGSILKSAGLGAGHGKRNSRNSSQPQPVPASYPQIADMSHSQPPSTAQSGGQPQLINTGNALPIPIEQPSPISTGPYQVGQPQFNGGAHSLAAPIGQSQNGYSQIANTGNTVPALTGQPSTAQTIPPAIAPVRQSQMGQPQFGNVNPVRQPQPVTASNLLPGTIPATPNTSNPGAQFHSSSGNLGVTQPGKPLISIVERDFGSNSHGARVMQKVTEGNSAFPVVLSNSAKLGGWENSVNQVLNMARTTGQSPVLVNISYAPTSNKKDGSFAPRYEMKPQETAALKHLSDAGGLAIVSGGNDEKQISPWMRPAMENDGVLVVGEAKGDKRAPNSSLGVHLLAPGGQSGGTSFAAAEVTRAASEILAVNPWLNGREIKQILTSTAKDVGPEGWDSETGFGILNTKAAKKRASEVKVQYFGNQRVLETLVPTNQRLTA
jgi:hypothetical protein